MSKEYELAFQMSADLDTKFSRVFTDASDRIGQLERKLKDVDRLGNGGGFGRGLINSLGNIGRSASTALGVGIGAAAAGGIFAAGVAIKSSIEKAMDFESEMSTIQALTGSTTDEMSKMQSLALKMGASTKYSALEAAHGIEELLKAGMQPATVQAGGLEAALNLATAGSLDLATAATVMSVSLNAFKKDGLTAAEAANILAGTANASATGVEDLQLGIAAVGAVASGLGITLRDTSTALGLFTNNGMSASDAGTSFKTMLQNLQPTTKDEIALFKKLGLTTANGSNAFFDAAGNIKSLDDISSVLQKSLKKLTSQQRSHTLELLFGTDAIRAANILYEEGSDGVKKFQKEMSKVTALDVARKKMDNAAGAVEQFKGAIETLQISALLPTMPIIKDLANAAADFTTKYTPQITEGVKKAIDNAKEYINNRYLNNQDFKNLDLTGKISFAIDDLGDVMSDWLDSDQAEKIGNIGVDIGTTLITAAEKAAFNTISANPTLALLLGGYLGLRSGGPLGLTVALTVVAAPWVKKFLDYIGENTNAAKGEKKLNNFSEFNSQLEQKDNNSPLFGGSSLTNKEPVKPHRSPLEKVGDAASDFASNPLWLKSLGNKISGYASGGYVSKPELAWVGEGKDPEWIIPQNNTARSRGLWESAGRSIGAMPSGRGNNGSSGNFVFSPVYNFNGPADQAAVQQMEQRTRQDFKDQLSDYEARERRLSFG